MTRPSAAYCLPPGDRDDAPIAPSSGAIASGDLAAAGRKPIATKSLPPIEGAPAAQLTAIADTLGSAQVAATELRAAFAAGDFKAADAAARSLRIALYVDLRVLTHQLCRAIARAEFERKVVEVPQ